MEFFQSLFQFDNENFGVVDKCLENGIVCGTKFLIYHVSQRKYRRLINNRTKAFCLNRKIFFTYDESIQ